MKNSLSAYLKRTLVSIAILLFSQGAYANHIIGMELEYAWVSGSTYQVNLVVYGDCGDVTGAFPLLPTSTPNVAVFNGATYETCLTLAVDSPSTGVLTSPVCPADTALTTCTSLSYTIPGIKKFVYSGTYTFSGTSHYWRFVFLGTMGTTSFAGRQATITNIVAPGTSVICLIDTLDNTYHNNVSSTFGNTPTPFYCLNNPNNYNPAATNADGDSIVYNLIPGEVGNYPVMICNTIPGTFVTYTGTAWTGQPITDTTPLQCNTGAFTFSHTNGDITFTPNATQRGLVVYNLDEYRNDTFYGNSQHELVFVVETCTALPPSAGITGATGPGLTTDSVNYTVCQNTGAFSFHLNPTSTITGVVIAVSASGIPAGASFVVTGDSTSTPLCTFSWTSTAVPLGTYTFYVTYTDNACPINGTQTTAYTIVVTAPPTVTASSPVCVGLTATLTPTPAGGIWSSGTTTVATIGSASGIVTGAGPGTSVISYSLGSGCNVTTIVTSNPIPAAISGATIVCPGSTIALSDITGPGTWSSSSTATATVASSGPNTGVVTGVAPATTTITYTVAGCTATKIVTVTALPPAIGGVFTVCQYATTALSDAGGGTWTSSNTGVATVGTSGSVTGVVGPGTSIITYSIGTGCTATAVVTVNPAPAVILGTLHVCGGLTTALTDGTTGGTWSSGNTTIASVGATGIVTGGSITLPSTVAITYTAPGGCSISATMTVNPAASGIGGSSSVCAGATTELFDVGSGTWTSSSSSVATLAPTSGPNTFVYGVATTGGTTVITYTLPTGCSTTLFFTVDSLASPITPSNPTVCGDGVSTVSLSDATGGGYWSSNNTAVASVNIFSGVVTGMSAGIDTIVYNVGCGASVVVTVNPTPPAIIGLSNVCPGATIPLGDAVTGGTWTSSNTAVATIGLTSGIAGGVSAAGGFVTITYTAPSGCSTTTSINIYSSPPAFPGTHVCSGQSATLTDPTSGGTWGSGNTVIASITVGPPGGVVTGGTPGTATITYTSIAGCSVTGVVTVNSAPGHILGALSVCIGSTITLTDGTTGGVWTSGTTAAATIGASTGIVSGVSITPPTTTITYSTGGTCVAIVVVTVDALPTAFTVTATGSYCAGGAGLPIGLSGSTVGIRYYLYLGGVLIDSVTGTGVAVNFGLQTAAGVYTATAYNITTTCSKAMTGSATITVTPLPSIYTVSISGGGSYCAGGSPAPIMLSGSDPGVTYKLYNGATFLTSITGTGGPIVFPTYSGSGTYTVTASSGTCTTTMTGSAVITIEPLPPPFTVTITGSGTYCPGSSGVNVELSGSTVGVNYQLYNGTTAVGLPVPGTGAAIPFGPQLAGVYTVVAVNTTTTCTRTMTGSATITVSPTPAMTGATAVCMGASVAEPVPGFSGGTWTSSNTAVATVVPTTGTVWGIITGTTTITYTSTSGCIGTLVVTVSPGPGAILGAGSVCVGATTLETDSPLGGLWTSSSTSTATVIGGSAGGTVTGVRTGTATITYSLGSGCVVSKVMTVTSAPGRITGSGNICTGACTTLTDGTTGGTWAISPASIATVSGTGVGTSTVCGVSAGPAVVIYTLGGCTASDTVTVSTAPGPVSGPSSVCVGSTITLTDPPGGGTWTSSATLIGTVDGGGVVLGEIGGVTTITYSLGGACVATYAVTVDPISAITGSMSLCVGTSTTLSDAATGGSWVSGSTGVATVNSSGAVFGVTNGTSVITYTTGAGCTATAIVTVNTAPLPISGVLHVCAGLTTLLSDSPSGGAWTSGSLSVASVGSTGTVYGISVTGGTAVITYSLGFGCTQSVTVTVNPEPSAIGGLAHVCAGGCTTLTELTTGGTWSSSNTSVATFASALSGTVCSLVPGTSTIVYTTGSGCPATTILTVNSLPAAIGGTLSVCVGATTALTDITTGGTWSSSSTLVATISATGVVRGLTGGFTTITYTAAGSGCPVTALVTVLPPPPAISGGPMVCVGQLITLADGSTGGTWSTGSSSLATIDSLTGALLGVSSGTVLVSYTIGTGCSVTSSVIVNALSPVMGDAAVCAGLSVTLADTTAGGSWSSSNPSVATAYTYGLTTGVVTGVSGGTDTIIYTLPTGCSSSFAITVNPAPPPISGPRIVCYGSSVSLGDGTTGGTWSSSNTVVATVNSVTGVVYGAYYSGGTATITYTLAGTGCPALAVVTVNPVPPAISGVSTLCIGTTMSVTDALSGGVWGSTDTLVATVTSAGIVSGRAPGTTAISYIYGGCPAGLIITVDAPPAAIGGPSAVCGGSTITLLDPTPGGVWGASGPASVDSFGDVTGGDGGLAVITYTTSTGCTAVKIVTVNPQPGPVGGSLCQGTVTTFRDEPTGGTWSSDNTAVVLIDTLTGVAGTPSAGVATLTYTSAAGCSVTGLEYVNPSPGTLTGSFAICLGFTTTLNDTSSGGVWSSSNTLVAPVDGSGDVTGAAPGTSTISYTSGGCSATAVVTVNSIPGGITGAMNVCVGSTTALGDIPAGGTWLSSDPTIASINLTTGVVTGVSPSTAVITYSLGAGCTTFTTLVVNPVPAAITGTPLQVCQGQSGALFDGTSGGLWSSSNTEIATLTTSLEGVYTGYGAGTATISYTLGTGCAATTVVTVNVQPEEITGNRQICLNATQLLSDIPTGGTWSSSNGLIASVSNPAVGLITGRALGAATITYTLGSCFSTATVVVNPLPAVFNVTGGGNYCAGGTGVDIGLDGSAVGVNYLLYHGSTATGTVSGTGTGISFGLQRVAGGYTVIGISTATGCSNIMAGSASVGITPTTAPSVSVRTGTGDTVCAGTSTTFTPTPFYGGSTPAYQWSVNGVAVSTSPTYTFIPANGDVVTVILTSDSACASPATASATVTMTVWSQELPVANVSVTPGDTVCQGTAVALSAMPLYGGSSPSYTWMKNGVSSGTGAAYIYVPVNGDMLYLSMTSNYPCRTASTVLSNVITMNVDTPQMPVVAITASPGTSVAIGQFDTLTAVVTNGGPNPQYQWVVNEIPVAGATANTYISNNFQYPNEDSVTCIVTSDEVCSATSYMWVYISLHPEGVATQTTEGGFTILPNPNKGSFTIKGSLGTGTDEEVSIELTDMLGQVVYKEKVQAPGGKVNERITVGETIANGMYLLNLRSGDANSVFHVVIEQ